MFSYDEKYEEELEDDNYYGKRELKLLLLVMLNDGVRSVCGILLN